VRPAAGAAGKRRRAKSLKLESEGECGDGRTPNEERRGLWGMLRWRLTPAFLDQ
jgi:hypothetical protein